MKRRSRSLKHVFSALLIAGLLFGILPSRTVSAAEGPVRTYEPQVYQINQTDSGYTVTNVTTGEELGQAPHNVPVLFPGDIIRFGTKATTNKNYGGWFWGLKDKEEGDKWAGAEDPALSDGEKHFEITKTESLTDESDLVTVIREMQVIGEQPVALQQKSGSFSLAKDILGLAYYVIPEYCNLEITWITGGYTGVQLTDEQAASAAFYTDATNPTKVYAVDGYYNHMHSANESDWVSVTIYRPYIEGYAYAECYSDYDTSKPYEKRASKSGQGDVSIAYTPFMSVPVSNGFYLPYGSYDDVMKVKFNYRESLTLTLDAKGGKIEGYDTRIYEIGNNASNPISAECKTIDEDFKVGKKFVPVKDGYTFAGWYEDEAYTKPVNTFLEILDAANRANNKICRVYAKWEQKTSSDSGSGNTGNTGNSGNTGNTGNSGNTGSTQTSGKWMSDSKGWWYRNADGTYPKSAWQQINGKWYHFDGNGYMQTGWQKIGGKWYLLASNGAMQTGWQKVGSSWYYLNSGGDMATGWVQDGGKWYYMNSSGVMQSGWVKVGNTWYYMNSSGVMQTGWQKISGKWYYLKSSGAMATGWTKVGTKWYYMNSSGVMLTGWQRISGKWYYLNSGGDMKTGWLKSGSTWYYFDNSGAMLANTSRKIGSKTYRFNASGACTNP